MPEMPISDSNQPEVQPTPSDLSAHQMAAVKLHKQVVSENGKYSPGIKAGGAHYVPTVDKNAQMNGIMCKNCVFYKAADSTCEIVDGPINENGVCRNWNIPDAKLALANDVKKSAVPKRLKPRKPKGGC